MYSLVIFLLAMLSLPSSLRGIVQIPIKDGYYRIINPQDGLALTATQQGRPGLRFVVTDEWVSAPTQQWKVKTIPEVGLQIIRNEEVRDNEVSKEEADDSGESTARTVEENRKRFKQVEWNLVEQEDGLYEVNNGFGCLHAHGKGERISIDEDCDSPHKWEFVYLTEIKKK